MPDAIRVPVSEPHLPDSAIEHAINALKSASISGASEIIPQVEEIVASGLGYAGAALVSNGSCALILALRTLDVRAGDEVLVPNFCYAAVASAVTHVGAQPVFCDVGDDWNLAEDSARAMLSERTAAIITVDNYGIARDWSSFHLWARRHGLGIVHDSAEAHGAEILGRPTGHTADIVTTSFFANKILTSGEGGALLFPAGQSYEGVAKKLRGQGMSASYRYWFDSAGYNFRMPASVAALLPSQIDLLPQILESRREIFQRYDNAFAGIATRPLDLDSAASAPWLYTVTFTNEDVSAIAGQLAQQGIESRPAFYPLSTMPAFAGRRADECPNSTDISRRSMSLPTSGKLPLATVDDIAQQVIIACERSA